MIGAIGGGGGGAEPHPLPKIVINNYVNVMMIAFKVKALICQVKINHLKRHLLLATTNHRCRHTKSNSYKLLSYRPPDWASHLQMIPLVKVKLFQPFTPIHKWSLPNISDDIDIYIKRDDMTGSVLSGNKNLSETGCHGNMLLNSLMGASMYLVPIKAQEKTDLEPRMQRLAHRLQEEKGIKAYSIPIGGSNVVGLHGYLCGWQELLEQMCIRDSIYIKRDDMTGSVLSEFIKKVAQQTSILLDHTYTGKSALALTNELRKHRSKFKGSRILFLHSGGIFSMFDGRLGDVQMQSAGETLVQNWMNPEDEPTIV
ncbi:bifunctional D-cysteine desulfhydrase/1-aminocyclopropane-1-carboxylate deaminase, mitochondrial-like [Anneissia japonica]|uniref:bifunctional D-cysteine desulfhydrase/1-aminocyclopropane-1-carboxylate deaminase, mitochondrial-like n=1 Tax=Anneissia japonica TaxID=1529436 RepID=UPI001425A8BB|nr:bifunctional D-cysteine desulfhydrase/1-aminocyclopropane-1-carboxylate deaminase, mitochondrial-like [Anneissia japonica]